MARKYLRPSVGRLKAHDEEGGQGTSDLSAMQFLAIAQSALDKRGYSSAELKPLKLELLQLASNGRLDEALYQLITETIALAELKGSKQE